MGACSGGAAWSPGRWRQQAIIECVVPCLAPLAVVAPRRAVLGKTTHENMRQGRAKARRTVPTKSEGSPSESFTSYSPWTRLGLAKSLLSALSLPSQTTLKFPPLMAQYAA